MAETKKSTSEADGYIRIVTSLDTEEAIKKGEQLGAELDKAIEKGSSKNAPSGMEAVEKSAEAAAKSVDDLSKKLDDVSAGTQDVAADAAAMGVSLDKALSQLGGGKTSTPDYLEKLDTTAVDAAISVDKMGASLDKALFQFGGGKASTPDYLEKLDTTAVDAAISVDKMGASLDTALSKLQGGTIATPDYLSASMQKLNTASVSAAQSVDKTEQELKQAGNEAKKAGDKGKKAGREITDSFKDAESQSKALTTAIKGVMLGYTGKALTEYFITSNASLETSQKSLSTLLGSEEKASGLMKSLLDFKYFDTGTSLPIVTGLASAGVETNKLIKRLEQLGAVSQGNVEILGRVSLAYSQMTSKGYVTAQDMMQMLEAGVPMWNLLADAMGKTVAEVQELTGKGEVSINDLNKALEKATSEGGKYFGMLEAQSDSFNGKIALIKKEIAAFGREAGKEAFGKLSGYFDDLLDKLEEAKADGTLDAIAKDVGEAVSTAVQGIISISKFLIEHRNAVGGVITAYIAFKTAISIGNVIAGVIIAVKSLTAATESATAAQAVYNATAAAHPAVLVIAAIAGIVGALATFSIGAKDSADKMKALNSETQTFVDKTANLKSLISEYEELAGKVSRTAEEQKRLIELDKQIITLSGGKLSAYELENASLKERIEYYQKYYEEEKKTAQAIAEKNRDEAEKIAQLTLNDAIFSAGSSTPRDNRTDLTNLVAKTIEDTESDSFEARKKALEALLSEFNRMGEQETYAYKVVVGILEEISEAAYRLTEAESNLYYVSDEGIAQREKALKEIEARMGAAAETQKRTDELIANSATNAATAMKEMGSAVTTAAGALEEMSETGQISYNTALSLIESGYASAVAFDQSTGAISLNIKALKDLVKAKNEAVIAAKEEELAELKSARARITINSMYDYLYNKDKIAETDKAIKDLETAIAALEGMSVNLASGNYAPYTESSKSSGKSAADLAAEALQAKIQAYNEEISYQKWRQDIGVISEQEYYKKLGEARKRYLKQGSDEWRSSYQQSFEYIRQTADEQTAAILETMNKVVSARDSAMQKMVDNAKLYTKEAITIPETTAEQGLWKITTHEHTEEGMNTDNSRLREALAQNATYEALRKKLKDKGANEYIIETFDSLSVEDAILYAQSVLSKSTSDWTEYNALAGQVKSSSQARATRMYQSEVDDLRQGFADKVNSVFSGLTGDMALHGQDLVRSLVDGWNQEWANSGFSSTIKLADVIKGGTLSTAPASAQLAAQQAAAAPEIKIEAVPFTIDNTQTTQLIIGGNKFAEQTVKSLQEYGKKVGIQFIYTKK